MREFHVPNFIIIIRTGVVGVIYSNVRIYSSGSDGLDFDSYLLRFFLNFGAFAFALTLWTTLFSGLPLLISNLSSIMNVWLGAFVVDNVFGFSFVNKSKQTSQNGRQYHTKSTTTTPATTTVKTKQQQHHHHRHHSSDSTSNKKR